MGRISLETWKARALIAESWPVAEPLPGITNSKEAHEAKKVALVENVHSTTDLRASTGQILVDHYPLLSFLLHVCTNTYNATKVAIDKGKDVAHYVFQNWKSRYGSFCYVIAMLLRLRSQLNCPEIIVAVSLMAFQCHLPRKLWDVMAHLKILMGHKWTQDFLLRCVNKKISPGFIQAESISVACYDNCGYHISHQYERLNTRNEYYDTVNWYFRYIPKAWEPDVIPDVAYVRTAYIIGHNMSPDYRDHTDLLDFCSHYIGSLRSDTIMEYPNDPDLQGATRTDIGTPLVDCSTGSYTDNCRVMWFIHYFISLIYVASNYIFIVGDEQTFDRMVKLKSQRPQQYWWLIPIPGEFHFTGHVLAAIYRLWWPQLLHSCSVYLQRRGVDRDWGMAQFNRHDEFMFIIITALHRWFEHVFGPDCLMNETRMRYLCRHNATSTLLLDFMYCDGMPYAALRRLLRMSPSPRRRRIINLFYAYYCMRMRSVNKYLYSMLCVHYLFMVEHLHPALYRIWERVYTASILGTPGRSTPLDGYMEKVNKYGKQLLGNCITALRVQTMIPLLNVLLRVYERFMQAWGRPGRQWAYMGAPTFEDDVDHIFRLFTIAHADDWLHATAVGNQNAFVGGAVNPNTTPNALVLNVNADWQDYVEEKAQPLTRWFL